MILPVRHRWEFELLQRAGGYRRSGPLGLRSAPNPDDDAVRIAYAVGRRVGGAVVRNRVRRRLRHVAQQLDRDGRIAPGRYLVIASPDAVAATPSQLAAHLDHLMTVTS